MNGAADILLVTGGCGFIGSNFIRVLLENEGRTEVLNYDALTYAGRRESLADVESRWSGSRYRFVQGDVADPEAVERLFAAHRPTQVIHFAAESHVDRSIREAAAFVRTNVAGTQTLLDAAREHGVRRFVQVSTDEVYGSLEMADPPFTEASPLSPSSPYAASKAAADLLVRAAHRTHGLDAIVTRCSNNYGPYQFPEKLIPLMILRALSDRSLPVYGDGLNVRDWIHVEDHARALLAVLRRGRSGAIYNIGASAEHTNLEIVMTILDGLGKPQELMTLVKDRPGHDRRYAVDASRLRSELGWMPRIAFKEGLRSTLEWYRERSDWWTPLLDAEFLDYLQRQYGAH